MSKEQRRRIRKKRAEKDKAGANGFNDVTYNGHRYKALDTITKQSLKDFGFKRYIPDVTLTVMIHEHITSRTRYTKAFLIGICEVLSGVYQFYGKLDILKKDIRNVELPPDICARQKLETGHFQCEFNIDSKTVYIQSCITAKTWTYANLK